MQPKDGDTAGGHWTSVILPGLLKLMQAGGQKSVKQVEAKIAKNEHLVIKGHDVTPAMLKEALEAFMKNVDQGASAVSVTPASVSSTQPANGSTTAISSGKRWEPTTTSGSLLNRIQMECEAAEGFEHKVVVTLSVPVLKKADVQTSTGKTLEAGSFVEVAARAVNKKDGRVYLYLRNSAGWICTRGLHDFSEVVLAPGPNCPVLDPPEAAVKESLAARCLPACKEDGKAVAAETPLVPHTFLATCHVSIISRPNITGTAVSNAGARIDGKKEFLADGVFVRPADGRAYLHLHDGKGWVCERARTDFSRFVVQPHGEWARDAVQEEEDPDDDAPLLPGSGKSSPSKPARAAVAQGVRRRGDGKKVIVLERAPTAPLAEAAGVSHAVDLGPAIFRSDADLWLKELGPARPLTAALRTKLRRLHSHYRQKVQDCEEDLAQVEEKVATYSRSCEAKKELQHYAQALKDEIAKLRQEWITSCTKELGSLSSEGEQQPSEVSGVSPVQVRGERWFCAVLRPAEEEGEGPRQLGPLRASQAEAHKDLERMKKQHEDGPEAGAGSSPAKRRRTSKGAAESVE